MFDALLRGFLILVVVVVFAFIWKQTVKTMEDAGRPGQAPRTVFIHSGQNSR